MALSTTGFPLADMIMQLFMGGPNAPQTASGMTSAGGTTSTTGSSSTTARSLTPTQQSLEGPLSQYITQLLGDPGSIAAPLQAQARNQVNATYGSLDDTLRQKFLSTGGGKSGKYGLATQAGEVQRLGDLSTADLSVLDSVLGRQAGAASLGATLLGQDMGSTTSSSGTGTTTSGSTTLGTSGSSPADVLTRLGAAAGG